MEGFIEDRDALITDACCGATLATWIVDIQRRSYKDGVIMPLAFVALGVSGEAAEVAELFLPEAPVRSIGWKPDLEKLTNELGDTLWYVNACAIHPDVVELECGAIRDIDVDGIKGQGISSKLLNISVLAGKIADRVKKTAWHGKPIDAQVLHSDLLELGIYLYALGEDYGIGFLKIATYNMDKLDKRYPQGKFVEGGGVR